MSERDLSIKIVLNFYSILEESIEHTDFRIFSLITRKSRDVLGKRAREETIIYYFEVGEKDERRFCGYERNGWHLAFRFESSLGETFFDTIGFGATASQCGRRFLAGKGGGRWKAQF